MANTLDPMDLKQIISRETPCQQGDRSKSRIVFIYDTLILLRIIAKTLERFPYRGLLKVEMVKKYPAYLV